jgi:hypothetical protein
MNEVTAEEDSHETEIIFFLWGAKKRKLVAVSQTFS